MSDEPKVIAIKLPFDLQERILSFPFIHAVSEFYPKADIHLITPAKEVEVLNLMPFKAYYHLFNEDEIKTILDVHPYTASANIYNVDLFVSLTNSFPDAALGLGLRAKKRVGFADNWKTLVLTHKTKRPVGHHVVEDFMTLFELMTGHPVNKRLRVTSRPLNKIIEGEDRYIAINLSPIRGGSIDEDWIELVSRFEGETIIFFSSDDQMQLKLMEESFIKLLPLKNKYQIFYHKDWIELGRMLSYASGVISYSGAAGALSAYIGTRALLLYDNEDPQRTGPFYFLTDVAVMGVNNPSLIHSVNSEKVLKDRVKFNMDEVFAKACEFFRL